MEIFSTTDDGEEYAVQVKDIPKKIKFSFMRNEYIPARIINFKSPVKKKQEILWIKALVVISPLIIDEINEYDDCKETETIVRDNDIVCPHIILYTA